MSSVPSRAPAGARVDPSAVVHASAHIGPEVEVGAGSEIYPNATLLGRVVIGRRVKIGPGAVIGWPGFGYERRGETYHHLEHDGPVIIEDDVDIGANCTIAAAKTGRETRVGKGTKIDCQVHIGHNVRIGGNCVIVAQSGIAGSSRLGDGVTLAGQTGVTDHVRIGDNAVVFAKSAVFRSIPAGQRYSGIPARPHDATKRFWARLWRRFGVEE